MLKVKTPESPSIMFDPQRRAASAELQASIKSLIAFLEQREADLWHRKRSRKDADRRNFHLAIEAIACNLAVLALLGGNRPLAVPRGSGVMWAKGRYSNPVYGQHFLHALDLMARPEVGLVDDLTRGYSFTRGRKQRSTIRATAAFVARVPPSRIHWEAFGRAEEPEVLILRGPKDRRTGRAELINYRNTGNTRRMRKEIQRLNAYLTSAPLSIVAGGGLLNLVDEDDQPVDPTRRSVRRIFNNGSWYQGGRLFDGFWESMRRADRFKVLRICTAAHPEGEAIANVDFSQLFPTLAYHRISHRVPRGDLYDVVGNGSCREGFKKLINALFFAEGPIARWPAETSSLFPNGTKLHDTINLIRNFHAPIAHLFGTGIGFQLMLIESGILIEALQGLYANGITALPLHDSVLVAASDAEAAREVMAVAFGRFTKDARANLKVDLGEQLQ